MKSYSICPFLQLFLLIGWFNIPYLCKSFSPVRLCCCGAQAACAHIFFTPIVQIQTVNFQCLLHKTSPLTGRQPDISTVNMLLNRRESVIFLNLWCRRECVGIISSCSLKINVNSDLQDYVELHLSCVSASFHVKNFKSLFSCTDLQNTDETIRWSSTLCPVTEAESPPWVHWSPQKRRVRTEDSRAGKYKIQLFVWR